MKAPLLLFVGLGLLAAPAFAEIPVHTVDWRTAEKGNETAEKDDEATDKDDELFEVKILAGEVGGVLRVQTTENGPHNVTVWTLQNPPIEGARWRLEGKVRHLDVVGEGHLVLWSTLDARDYITKTVAPSGPLGHMNGHSDWRPFVLPFDARDRKLPLEKLLLQVSLPGKGTVDLADLRLYASFDDAIVQNVGPRLGWNAATFGIAAGLLGCAFGLLGALMGLLNASKTGLRWVAPIQKFGMVLGGCGVVGGVAIIASGEAGGWLLSMGVLGIGLFFMVGRTLKI